MQELESLAGWMETVLDSTSLWSHCKSAQAPPGLSSRPRGAFAKATPTVRKENRPQNKSPEPVAQMLRRRHIQDAKTDANGSPYRINGPRKWLEPGRTNNHRQPGISALSQDENAEFNAKRHPGNLVSKRASVATATSCTSSPGKGLIRPQDQASPRHQTDQMPEFHRLPPISSVPELERLELEGELKTHQQTHLLLLHASPPPIFLLQAANKQEDEEEKRQSKRILQRAPSDKPHLGRFEQECVAKMAVGPYATIGRAASAALPSTLNSCAGWLSLSPRPIAANRPILRQYSVWHQFLGSKDLKTVRWNENVQGGERKLLSRASRPKSFEPEITCDPDASADNDTISHETMRQFSNSALQQAELCAKRMANVALIENLPATRLTPCTCASSATWSSHGPTHLGQLNKRFGTTACPPAAVPASLVLTFDLDADVERHYRERDRHEHLGSSLSASHEEAHGVCFSV